VKRARVLPTVLSPRWRHHQRSPRPRLVRREQWAPVEPLAAKGEERTQPASVEPLAEKGEARAQPARVEALAEKGEARAQPASVEPLAEKEWECTQPARVEALAEKGGKRAQRVEPLAEKAGKRAQRVEPLAEKAGKRAQRVEPLAHGVWACTRPARTGAMAQEADSPRLPAQEPRFPTPLGCRQRWPGAVAPGSACAFSCRQHTPDLVASHASNHVKCDGSHNSRIRRFSRITG
jgi:hypothetical protein